MKSIKSGDFAARFRAVPSRTIIIPQNIEAILSPG